MNSVIFVSDRHIWFTQDWQNTQFLHVFQEQLIAGQREEKSTSAGVGTREGELGLMETHLGAMVDLQQAAVFEEPFYIVVLEKSSRHTIVHMWRLVIASQPDNMGKLCYVVFNVSDENNTYLIKIFSIYFF